MAASRSASAQPRPRRPPKTSKSPRPGAASGRFSRSQAAAAGGASDGAWPQTPIDRFILAELEKRGLAPSPPADQAHAARRLTFDLIGLPPTPEEIDDFLGDDSPEAFERVVDRLLASPHYGERWGRHWLDVARYADTKGYVLFQDGNFPWAYTYRDYVVRRSTTICPTTGSSSSNWRPTSCRWAPTSGR